MSKIFDVDSAGLVPVSRGKMLQLSVLILRCGDVVLRSLRSLKQVSDVSTRCLKKEFKSLMQMTEMIRGHSERFSCPIILSADGMTTDLFLVQLL